MSFRSRLANVIRGERLNRELDEELESHLLEAIEAGRDPEEARRAFGSQLRHREASRDARLMVWLDTLCADLVFAWRQLRKDRITSLAAVFSLALAMGACMAAFRLIDALLLRPLPVAQPERLYVLTFRYRNAEGKFETGDSFSYPHFKALRDAVAGTAELLAISRPTRYGATFGSAGETERYWQQWMSGWTFGALGLKPAVGRLLTVSDDLTPGAHPVAVLSYDYWTRRFGRDPDIVGRKFGLGQNAYEIVGVCEKSFTGTEPGMIADVFVPTMMNTKAIENPNWSWVRIWVQLPPGARLEPAEAKLRAATYALRQERVKTWPAGTAREYIEEFLNAPLSLDPAAAGFSVMQRDYRRSLAVLGALVALVLLIACANVANLMTAQAAARAREMALRVSIGAGRARLVQLVLVQSVAIAVLASALGAVFAWWATPLVVDRIHSADNPVRLVLPADWRVAAFGAGLTLAVTLLFGLLPALRASAVRPMSALRGGETRRTRATLTHLLIAAQAAFCILVLFATALIGSTSRRLSHQPVGFDASRLLAVETVTHNNVPSTHWDLVRRHLESLPGVQSASICGWALLTGNGWSGDVRVNGKTVLNEEPYFLSVSPGWLATMRIPLREGRDFLPEDRVDGAAIVNDAFVRRYLDGRSPLGSTVETQRNNDRLRLLIVGRAGDARYRNMRESIRPTVYVPFETRTRGVDWATFMVRTVTDDPSTVARTLRREAPQARPEFRVVGIRTQNELIEQHTIRERLLAGLASFFACVAVLLAGIGLYGVLNYSVLRRRREIGIRIALGAPAGSVARHLTGGLFIMVGLGAVTGLTGGLLLQHYLENLLYQVNAADPLMWSLPLLALSGCAALAALPPVLRAVRIDPVRTLREE